MAFGPYNNNVDSPRSTMASSSPQPCTSSTSSDAVASLYIGETDNLDARIARHHNGRACAYTDARRPVELVYREQWGSRVEARQREHQLKRWTRRKKEALVAGNLIELKKLSL